LAPSSSNRTPTCSRTATICDLVMNGGPSDLALGRLQPDDLATALTNGHLP